jgi:hypothetical protein
LGGTSTYNYLGIYPVSWSSSLSIRLLRILKEFGTIPEEEPL